jgi:hypothetical protein
VEVIVFANTTTTDTGEVWPLTNKQYPPAMIYVGPDSDDQIRPSTLGQMEDLESYLNLWDTPATATSSEGQSDFLFESRRNRLEPITIEAPVNPKDDLEPVIDYDALFESDTPVAFQDLPRTQKMLSSIARSLNRSSMYRVLLHRSWLHPVLGESDATAILIQGGRRFDEAYELDGTITLSRSRFLHLETDLWFTQLSPLIKDTVPEVLAMSPLAGRLPVSRAISRDLRDRYPEVADWMSTRGQYIPVNSHHLDQSRRMRSATMHFIDHPRFGLLIRTERFEPDEE